VPVPEAVANYHCTVGENPRWHESEGRLYWLDIETGRLFRAEHATLAHECFYRGPVVGGFTFQADGTLLLFEANRIVSLDRSLSRRVLAEGVDADMARFNDCIADPEGRVFVGTIGKTDQSGGLYRVDHDGRVTCLFKGTGCANGMGFTRDLARFYWTCSTTRTIDVFDYDRATGALANRRRFYDAPETEGTPDGMTLDEQDRIWTTRWGGSAVLCLDAKGALASRIDMPVTRVSACAFGGPDLDVLYVTTAGGTEGADTADGTLYRVRVNARGRTGFRSSVRV
jgi:sugar lactone lactonase YvrE